MMKIIRLILSKLKKEYFKYFDYIGAAMFLLSLPAIPFALYFRNLGSVIYLICLCIWDYAERKKHFEAHIYDLGFFLLSCIYWVYIWKLPYNYHQLFCSKLLCI